MSRTDYVFLLCCTALIACAAAYHWHPSGPRYYPMEHTWRTEKLEGKPSMGWYWRSGWAFGVAAMATLTVGGALYAASAGTNDGESEQASGLPGWVYALLTVVVLASLTAVSIEIVNHGFTKWDTWESWTIPE